MSEFENLLTRLIRVVDAETEALRNGQHALLGDFQDRKSHGLAELGRLLGGQRPAMRGGGVAAALLGELGKKLEVNLGVLKLHLDAANEVAGVLSRAIIESESDGTYSQGHAWRGGGGW